MTVEHINDAFREADKLLEDWNNRLTLDNLSLVERYLKGELWLLCECIRQGVSVDGKGCASRSSSSTDSENFRAIFQGVLPIRGADSNRWEVNIFTGTDGAEMCQIEDNVPVCGPYRRVESVLVGVTKFMELPKGINPSLVRLQSLKETDGFGAGAFDFSQHA